MLDDPNPNGNKPKLAQPNLANREICVVPMVPMYSEQDEESKEALEAICRYAAKFEYTVYRPMKLRGSAVHLARNEMIAKLIVSGKLFTHVLLWDSDMIAEEDTLVRLLEHKVDIVAALCTTRMDPPLPNARMWDESTKHWEELWSYPSGLLDLEGGGVGTAVMLISRHALQQMAEVYFQCLYEKDIWQMPDERAKVVTAERSRMFDITPNAHWFRWLPSAEGAGENSEDMSFCWLAQRYAGLKVHVDTSIQPGHIGRKAYGIPDFEKHRDRLMEQARKEGRLKYRHKGHLNPIDNAPPTVDNSDLIELIEQQPAGVQFCPEEFHEPDWRAAAYYHR